MWRSVLVTFVSVVCWLGCTLDAELGGVHLPNHLQIGRGCSHDEIGREEDDVLLLLLR